MSAVRAHNRREWTREEVETLVKFTEFGFNAKIIAGILGRSYSSTACKRNRLGYRLYPPRIEEPHTIIFVSDIQRSVARHFNVPVEEMTSDNRKRRIARPRQIAMFLARELTNKSYPRIGELFGGKDHSTILHGKRIVEQLITEDERLAEDVSSITKSLTARSPVDKSQDLLVSTGPA